MVWKLLDLRLAERSLEVGARRRYPCTLRAEEGEDEEEDEDEDEDEEGTVEAEETVDAALRSLRGVLALGSTESAGPCPITSPGPSPCPDPIP